MRSPELTWTPSWKQGAELGMGQPLLSENCSLPSVMYTPRSLILEKTPAETYICEALAKAGMAAVNASMPS